MQMYLYCLHYYTSCKRLLKFIGIIDIRELYPLAAFVSLHHRILCIQHQKDDNMRGLPAAQGLQPVAKPARQFGHAMQI